MTRPSLACLPLWIGGRTWVRAAARYGEVTNPATGEVIRHVPLAMPRTSTRRCRRAQAALPDWREAPPLRRARILMRFRELMEAAQEGARRASSPRSTARRWPTPRARSRAASRWSSSRPASRTCSRASTQRERRHRRRLLLAAPAGRRVRRHHAVQLPGDGADVDVPGGDRLRQHVRPEALRARAVAGAAHGRAAARRRACPTACSTSCTATRKRSTRCSRIPDIKAVSFVGSTPIAQVHLRDGRAERQARAGARRRQEPRGRAARRRPRVRRRRADRRRLRLGRRALHGDLGGGRGRRCGRSAGRDARATRARADQGRPRRAPRHRDGSAGHLRGARAHRRATSTRAWPKARRWWSTAATRAVAGHESGFFVGTDAVRPRARRR